MSAALPIDLSGTVSSLRATIASGDPIDVRDFSVAEGLSELFEVKLVACSPTAEIDFEAVVGQPARFSISAGTSGVGRLWDGVCTRIDQVDVEDVQGGLSTYEITIVPTLWLLTQRRNHRMFQGRSEPEIVLAILAEWGIEPEVRLEAAYKAREYRLQYAESDYAFVRRMLEDAGITFFFEIDAAGSRLVLSDAPHTAAPRQRAIPFAAAPNPKLQHEFVTSVVAARKTRPGKYVQRDWDFRRTDAATSAKQAGLGSEALLERFHYVPNALHFFEGPGPDFPVGDDRGKFRRDEAEGDLQVARRLDAKRGDAQTISFATSARDLRPGSVFVVSGHPSSDVVDRPLLVVGSRYHGDAVGDWFLECDACPADVPFRPKLSTPKPQVMGIEPATVVGPAGEEIHTDEFGRVRVHFHWDRESRRDEPSSVWIPVAQAWGGLGYGHIDVPRVGHEVIVDFLCGDPDQPIVVGRIYTAPNPVPYALPRNKTKSGWKSDSSPGGGGYNEIMLEDKKGEELVRYQAEKNSTALVKNDAGMVVLRDKMSHVGRDHEHTVMQDQTQRIRCHRRLRVENQQSHWVDRDVYQEVLEGPTTARSKLTDWQHSNEVVLQSVAEMKVVAGALTEQPIKSFLFISNDAIIIEAPAVDINPENKTMIAPPPKRDALSRAEQRDWYFFGGPEEDESGVS